MGNRKRVIIAVKVRDSGIRLRSRMKMAISGHILEAEVSRLGSPRLLIQSLKYLMYSTTISILLFSRAKKKVQNHEIITPVLKHVFRAQDYRSPHFRLSKRLRDSCSNIHPTKEENGMLSLPV